MFLDKGEKSLQNIILVHDHKTGIIKNVTYLTFVPNRFAF